MWFTKVKYVKPSSFSSSKVTNKQIEYTLKKGFNDAECQEWIIKALKDHKELSRKQINELLWNKLPVDFTEKTENRQDR